MSEFGLIFIGMLFSGLVRLTFGQIIIREEGRWQFRWVRFDARDREVIDRVERALEIGRKSGRIEAYHEWEKTGVVSSPYATCVDHSKGDG